MKSLHFFLFISTLTFVACGGGSSDGGDSPGNGEDPPQSPTTFSSSLFVKSSVILPGPECANGGISVSSGLDNNNNQMLDDSEIVETQIVCNGTNGTDGTNGDNGNNGLNSLVSVSDEPVGVNCGAGGKKIEVGLDSNANNTLDASEVTSTEYVCHGLSDTGGTGNTNCTIVTAADNSTVLQCGDQSVVLVPGYPTDAAFEVNEITGGFEIIDSWQSSGGRNRESYRNPHYLIDVTQDGDITIDITSNSANYIYLVDSLGLLVTELNNGVLTRTLPADTYTIVAATYNPNISENFTVQVLGNNISNISKIASDHLTRADLWLNSGGRNVESFRNHHYTFTTDRATYIDAILESSVSTSMYLLNSQGIIVASSASTSLVSEVHAALPADTYTLIAATYNPGISANYTLNLYGQYSGFSKISNDTLGIQDNWTNSGGRNTDSYRNHHYTINVAQPTYLDVILSSSVSTALYLIDSQDIIIGSSATTSLVGQVSQKLEPGTYSFVAATYNPGESADYTLEFVGHFTSIEKVIASPVTQLTGSWTNSAGRNTKSYRNNHYQFSVAEDTYVDMLVTSSVGVSMYLINSLDIIVASSATSSLSGQISSNISAGDYTLVVGTYNPGLAANYTLEMHGMYNNFAPVASQSLSTTGAWTSSGGADPNSANNPHYSITVTESSYVDIMIESTVDNYLYLVDDLGIVQMQIRGNVLSGEVSAGNYTIVAATWAANQTSNYRLSVVGQIAGLTLQ